jgi:RNA polymerase sigma-70 factor (ECF subfamily)
VTARSDVELLDRWRTGDTVAGQTLFARHFESIYRFFCNKVGRDVDDLVQETFLGCVHSKDRFRGDSSFRTFLFAIARNQLLKHRERWSKANGKQDFEESRVALLDSTPSKLAVDHEEQELLLRALRRLPLDLQIALELFYWEGLRSKDIAAILEIPHGTARSRLRRARELLREHVDLLARTPSLRESTTANFDRWLKSIRDKVPNPERKAPASPT